MCNIVVEVQGNNSTHILSLCDPGDKSQLISQSEKSEPKTGIEIKEHERIAQIKIPSLLLNHDDT